MTPPDSTRSNFMGLNETTQLQSESNHRWIAPEANLEPALYIVSTPIGNLRDMSLRALDVLSACEHILAEDTRQTAKLLSHFSIKTPLSAYHDHNAAKRVPKLVETLEGGAIMALVSDAGTPLVSDPGYKLVRAAIEAGVNIIPIPGASAVLAALTLSGLPSDRFSFGGFLPPKSHARCKKLESYKGAGGTLMFFETAPRLAASLSDIMSVLGDRPMALLRELTKRYEQARRGLISEIIAGLDEDPPRGEIVLCIGPALTRDMWDEAELRAALPDIIAEMGVKRATEQIAEISGWVKRDVYQLAIKIKNNEL